MKKSEIILQNARLFYSRLYQPNDDGKYSVSLIVDDTVNAVTSDGQAPAVEALKNMITRTCRELNPSKDKTGQGALVPPERMFMRKGSHCEPDDIFDETNWRVRANSRKNEKPYILDGHGKETDEKIPFYMGCRVNVKLDIGFMEKFTPRTSSDGSPPKEVPSRVTARFIAIQFAGDDETLDPHSVSAEDAQEGFGSTGYTPSAPAGGSPNGATESFDNEAFG